jgi:thioredoxin 1
VDEQREIAGQYGVTAMPTFMIFKDGKKVEEIRGADVRALKAAVEKVAGELGKAGEEKVNAKKPEVKEQKKDEEEKTVSGSYGMTGGNNWKMSLH